MTNLLTLDEVVLYNERSLKTLVRSIHLSQDQFSLILVRCNYAWLTEQMSQKLKQRLSVELGELALPNSVKTLYTTIQEHLGKAQPQALMIFNLEAVTDIEQVLNSTNQVREEFRKRFPFPLILCINDWVLEKLIRYAPDFKSWAASSIKFELATSELINFLRQEADTIFNTVVDAGAAPFLSHGLVNFSIGSLHRRVLHLAQQDLQNRGIGLEPALAASLEFILGRDDYANDQLDLALEHYQKSLAFWQGGRVGKTDADESLNPQQCQEREGILLFYIGLCSCRQADLQPAKNQFYWQEARRAFQNCVEVLERSGHLELVAQFIGQLGKVLRQLRAWKDLDLLAQKALNLHQDLGQISDLSFEVQLAQDYGFQAEVALHRLKWRSAKRYAEQALRILGQASTPIPQHQALYLLLLARSRKHLGNPQLAILDLEQAKELQVHGDRPLHQNEPQLYIQILQELRGLYFDRGHYLEAFKIKQEQHQIEHQYGFRAFIGTTQLQPQQQALNPAQETPVTATVAHEITAASRQQDINRLLERVSRDDYKLIVIHGQSGVGKSSMVNAGLVPALQQRAIGDRTILPVVLSLYTDWGRELGKRIASSCGGYRPVPLTSPPNLTDSKENEVLPYELVLAQLRQNINRNLLTVLIFDQFEEFFFVYPHHTERKEFYDFLSHCLNLPFVKVILSMRDDYLHDLLDFERFANLEAINNNILDKNIRYQLGNFVTEDARNIFQELTRKTRFQIDSELIDELVRDLSIELGQVRPIELQLVGAQLQEEEITTLSQYWQLGSNPKEKLIERSLVHIIQDCGSKNNKYAWNILSNLVDENNARPLKTKNELSSAIGESVKSREKPDIISIETRKSSQPSSPSKLDLILQIFEGSGLVYRHREESGDRYQLVHDYLVRPIRQRSEVNLAKRLAKSEAAQKLSQTQLEQRNRQLKRLVSVLAGVSCCAFFSLYQVAVKNIQLEYQKNQEETIASTISSEVFFFSNKQKIDALLESLRAWKQWDNLNHKPDDNQTKLRVIATVQQALYHVRERNVLEGHRDSIWDIKYSPDGQAIASASTDGTVKLWRPDGTLMSQLSHDNSVTKVSFSPDNQIIATASWDKTIKLWQLDGTLIDTLQGHRKEVYSVSFSPDGQSIASGGKDCTLRLWSLDGQEIRRFSDPSMAKMKNQDNDCQDRVSHRGHVLGVSFSPDGQLIASSSSDKTVKLWQLDGTLVATLQGHTNQVNDVTFTPNGQLLVTASHDKSLKFWSLAGVLVKTIPAHTDPIHSVNFSPDGRILASTSDDNTIKLWHWDGRSLNTLTLFDTLEGHSDAVTQVSFHPRESTLTSASMDKSIKLWSLDRQLQGRRLTPHGGGVDWVSFSPDGKTIASAGTDKTIRLWQSDGTLKGMLQGHNDRIYNISFSPDGQLLASASRDCTVKLWHVDGTLLKTFGDRQLSLKGDSIGDRCSGASHSDYALAVSFSPDGKTIASTSRDKTIKLWNLDGQLLNTLRGHTERVNSVSFSPDGQFIASGSDDQTVRVWHRDGRSLITIESDDKNDDGHTSYVTSVVFAPDGQTLASAGWDNVVKIWDLNGQLLQDFSDSDSVNSVSFSPGGQFLAAASWDGTVKLWSLKDGTLIKAFQGHDSGVLGLSFSPDGQTIASASDDRTVILWNLDLDRLLVDSCNWIGDYLRTNSRVSDDDRSLCDPVLVGTH